MSEHQQADTNSNDHGAADARRSRDAFTGRAHDSMSDALHEAFPGHGARRSHFPKDDRRSSARLTEREQNERWPLG